MNDLNLNVNYSYPNNPDYDIVGYLDRIDLNKEKEDDLHYNNGFIISSPKTTLKKDIKNPDGIFSTKFGQTMGDPNPYQDRYSCRCGNFKGKVNSGLRCPICNTVCQFVDDNFGLFGWIELIPEYSIIHPIMYKQLESFFGGSKIIKNKKKKKGSVLLNIIDYDQEISQDGYEVGQKDKKSEPFYGIGMIDFKERFDEILEFYHAKYPNKEEIYQDILKYKDIIFTNSIPVFTTLLRPVDVVGKSMYYEKTNEFYNLMVKQAKDINNNKRKMDRNKKVKSQYLCKLQTKYIELYDEIVEILNGKKGVLRSCVSGRFNFSSRNVIKQNPMLRIDQVELPYYELVIVLQQKIINILHRTYNITYQEAYDKWFRSIAEVDPIISKIIEDIIRSSGEGLPVIINRNPTINYGSIMQMFCIGINYNFCMSTPLQILRPLAADYDGDVLNIMHIINESFFKRANEIFNPRNAMYISRNDGMLNKEILPQKDTIVNVNTLNDLTYHNYTNEEMNHIQLIKEKQKQFIAI